MPNDDPLVSVIVPHYNDLDSLAVCLDALSRQTYSDDAFEIIVADNASPVGLTAVERVVMGRARVVLATIKGAGPARNAGVEASRGSLLAFTDSDCVPVAEWLEKGLAGLKDYDFVGGRVTVLVDPTRPMTGPEAFERVFAFRNDLYVKRKGFTGSGNLFCPRTVFDTTGPFRTGVSEDLEWSHRARSKGFRLGYVHEAAVGHPPRSTWAALVAKWRRINRESYGVTMMRKGGTLRWFGRTWLLPISIVPHALVLLASPAVPTVRERLRALRTLTAIRLWRFWDQHILVWRG